MINAIDMYIFNDIVFLHRNGKIITTVNILFDDCVIVANLRIFSKNNQQISERFD